MFTIRQFLGSAAAAPLLAARPRRTTMGFTSDSFQLERFSTPKRILEIDRLLEIAAEFGAGGGHGGLINITPEYARKVRRMKEELDMYVESRGWRCIKQIEAC